MLFTPYFNLFEKLKIKRPKTKVTIPFLISIIFDKNDKIIDKWSINIIYDIRYETT